MPNGKLEGRITVPTGGWDLSLVETGGSSGTVTVPAATYYHSTAGSGSNDYAAELKAQLDSVGDATYTVTVDATESGTGKYTISATGGGVSAFAITWTDTDQRDLLGFSQGNLSSALTYTADDQARALWFPNFPVLTLNHSDTWRGWDESDLHDLESPAGDVYNVSGERKEVIGFEWQMTSAARTWIVDESTVNESFQRFWRDCIYGGGPGCTAGGAVRWHEDADTDATYGTYKVVGAREFKPGSAQEGWTGRFNIALSRCVRVSSELSS